MTLLIFCVIVGYFVGMICGVLLVEWTSRIGRDDPRPGYIDRSGT